MHPELEPVRLYLAQIITFHSPRTMAVHGCEVFSYNEDIVFFLYLSNKIPFFPSGTDREMDMVLRSRMGNENFKIAEFDEIQLQRILEQLSLMSINLLQLSFKLRNVSFKNYIQTQLWSFSDHLFF